MSSDLGRAASGYNFNLSPQAFQNVAGAWNNRKSAPSLQGSQFWGKGSSPFSLGRGIEHKAIVNSDGTVSWRGFSGVLQFLSKFPFGYMTKSAWGKTLNQIFWNIVIFVLLFGGIYGLMIRDGHFSVPDSAIEQQNQGSISATGKPENKNFMYQGLYFATVTTTTLGFGDITPSTVGGQVMVMFHLFLFITFNFIFALDFGKN